MTNIHQERHDRRIEKIHQLFESCYLPQIDDFFDARDQLLQDISEVFLQKYSTSFKSLALDDYDAAVGKEARRILAELSKKI